MTRFFKKVSPQVVLLLASGRGIKFDNVDGEVGIVKVSNDAVIDEMAQCIRSEIGGVSEITEAEYNALVEKKTTFRPRWRDEISKQGSASLPLPTAPLQSQQNVAVSVEGGFQPPPADRVTPTAQQTPNFRPTAIPRK